ncbi:unnamed protein product, partial [Closterium sp. Naga37s-1]
AGPPGRSPPLSKMNDASAWEKRQAKGKEAVERMVGEMMDVYVKRLRQRRPVYPKFDAEMQRFGESFAYKPTPDQEQAFLDVERDMCERDMCERDMCERETPMDRLVCGDAAFLDVERDMCERETPMDRLVCGDVGFGKTEVAVRAIFRAVLDKRQAMVLAPTTVLAKQHYKAMVLAPTTVLAKQHYKVISARLKDYGVRVALLSRFQKESEKEEVLAGIRDGTLYVVTDTHLYSHLSLSILLSLNATHRVISQKESEKKEVLAGIRDGTQDVVAGTHSLLGAQVVYHNLGLLVIDEEQRFGVRQKERISSLKTSVDVLTLSATPIPRTLYMSMHGFRDASRITTPPPERQPIDTHLLEFDLENVKRAIGEELERGGQVFYVVPRVEGIEEIQMLLEELFPSARVDVAHGKLRPTDLEAVMERFGEGEVDVLVCTSIIESGIDIRTVNTIVIEDTHLFGLAQIYQLRGRVGRSSSSAHAYLFHPPLHCLTPEAQFMPHAPCPLPHPPCPMPSAPCPLPHPPCPMPHAPLPMPHASCPMPHAPCLMPHASCPMPHCPCPMPHAPCLMPHASCPMPHCPCPMPHAPCLMPHASCPMPHCPCPMPHAPCLMPHASCPMPHCPCPMPHAPCLMPHASCPMPHCPCPMPHAPCLMPHASCPMPHCPCPMPHAPCLMPHASCPMHHFPMPLITLSRCPFPLAPCTHQERLRDMDIRGIGDVALQQHSGLGEGYLLAQRDMDIRGIGDVFGERQSGDVGGVGYYLFMEMLHETLTRVEQKSLPRVQFKEVRLDLPLAPLPPIPAAYVSDGAVRVSLPREAEEAAAEGMAPLLAFSREMRAEYGDEPAAVEVSVEESTSRDPCPPSQRTMCRSSSERQPARQKKQREQQQRAWRHSWRSAERCAPSMGTSLLLWR